MLASGRGGTGGAAGPAPDGLLGAPQEEAPSLSRPATMPAPSLLLALALASAARFARTAGPPLIRLRGPESGPVLEGSAVTLECLSSAEEAPALAFQKYGQWLQAWVSLDEGTKLIHGFYNAVVSREGGHLLLTISSVQSWHAGAYRCVSSNATSNASSADLDLQIEYLRDIFLSRAKSWCGTVGDSVTVLEGDDLQLHCFAKASRGPLYEWSREGEDWIVASSSLALTKVNLEQAGTYTCRARHPSVAQLAKTKSLRLFVEGSQRGVALEFWTQCLASIYPAILRIGPLKLKGLRIYTCFFLSYQTCLNCSSHQSCEAAEPLIRDAGSCSPRMSERKTCLP
ncbi:basal cell adhesion molecule-like isoform X3 [Sceloporus undulatus]|uniref:basal cell adhesion molecule-like isoform X3 n=1 Tax=Sceloporus undulatus TaxID=8520 RepID=UPI001C4D63F0|nr:basal cell adhesion molecule-like isoform X3 [Sceloporus undulatus]